MLVLQLAVALLFLTQPLHRVLERGAWHQDGAPLARRHAASFERTGATGAARRFRAKISREAQGRVASVDPSDSAEAESPAGIDSDPGDDVATTAAADHRQFRTAGLSLPGGRSVPLASARCSSRSARGPPAAA